MDSETMNKHLKHDLALLDDILSGFIIPESVDTQTQLKRLMENAELTNRAHEAFDALLDIWNMVVHQDEDQCPFETNAFAKAHNLLVRTGLITGVK